MQEAEQVKTLQQALRLLWSAGHVFSITLWRGLTNSSEALSSSGQISSVPLAIPYVYRFSKLSLFKSLFFSIDLTLNSGIYTELSLPSPPSIQTLGWYECCLSQLAHFGYLGMAGYLCAMLSTWKVHPTLSHSIPFLQVLNWNTRLYNYLWVKFYSVFPSVPVKIILYLNVSSQFY